VIESMDRMDDLTVDIALSKPFPHLIEILDFGILPRHLLAGQPLKDNPFNLQPVGAGPYRVQSISRQRLNLIANEKYYGGTPQIRQLSVLHFDAEELWRRLLARQIDVAVMIPWSKQRFLRNLKTVGLDQSTRILGTALLFNRSRPPFSEHKARVAFASAID